MTMPRTVSRKVVVQLLAGLVGFAAAGCSSTASEAGDAGSVTTKVELLSPEQNHYGKSYADWNAAWWQWYYRAPGTTHPVTDPTGKYCGVSQDAASPVFFLAGTSGGVAKRACTIPANKALFFPLLNIASDNGGVPKDEWATAVELEADLKDWGKSVRSSFLIVDGVRFDDLHPNYLVPVTRFKYDVPAGDNIYAAQGAQGVSGTVDPSFSTGVYVMLPPLSPGKHTVRFGGENSQYATTFSLDVTYELTVE